MQGIFIFVLHVLMIEKVRTAVSRWLRHGWCCFSNTESAANYNSKEYVTRRQRFLNMIRSTAGDTGGGEIDEESGVEKRKKRMRKEDTTSSTGPSTASTDTKDKGPLTPTSKTSAWLSQIPSQDDGNDYDLPPLPTPEVRRAEIKDQPEIKYHEDEEEEDHPPPLPSSPPPPLTPPTSPRMQYLEAPVLPPPDYDDEFIVPPLSRSTRSLDLRETDNRTPVRRKKFPLGATDEERGAAPLHATDEELSRL